MPKYNNKIVAWIITTKDYCAQLHLQEIVNYISNSFRWKR